MMSEQAVTTTTSFIDSSSDGLCKQPPISSNSSIDSGCNSSTNDSITSGSYQSSGAMSSHASAPLNATQIRQTRPDHLLMLPPQPNVPPPPPPPPPQLQESFYGTTDDSIYNNNNSNRVSLYGGQAHTFATNQLQQQASAIYGTYTNESPISSNIATSHSSPLSQANLAGQLPLKAQHPSNAPQTFQQSVISQQRSSTSSLESSSSTALMPMNVKAMLLHGLPSEEVLRNWLSSIKCDEHIENFIYHGYDMHLVTRMTPQDLAAIGCKSPALRKKLTAEIRKLNLEYEIPDFDPATSLLKWLEVLKLSSYYSVLMKEGCDTIDKACQLTWEDLEEIGITKLGHQKRLLMAIERVRKCAKQQENSQNDCAIYDVHPNHRVSLNGALPSCEHRYGTVGRVRSGLFQTRSGANLDYRGLPVATVMPALKHINSQVVGADNKSNSQVFMQLNESAQTNNAQCVVNGDNGATADNCAVEQQIYESTAGKRTDSLNLGDLGPTMRRIPPPMPPVRTNSLRVPGMSVHQGNACNTFAGPNGTNTQSNATSFLRVPKLGTLTATTNKMLASGGHIKTLSSSQSIYSPVRQAPLPPNQQNLQQHNIMVQGVAIPEKIDEETCVSGTTGGGGGGGNLMAIHGDQFQNNIAYIDNSQLSSPEFPPPPPCQ